MKTTQLLPILFTALAAVPAQAQWSATDSLSVVRGDMAAVTVGDLMLFAGGRDGNTTYSTVDIYDATTGTWSSASLSQPRAALAATVVGHLAFFAGGATDGFVESDVVDVFDSQTMMWTEATLSQPRAAIGATSVGNKAIFAGGGGLGFVSDTVDIYDVSTDMWSTTTLSTNRSGIAAVTVGDLAIFAGGAGLGGVPLADVDLYDDSTGLWSVGPPLSVARLVGEKSAVAVGTRAYFAGGHFSQAGGPNMSNHVDIYDAQSGWSTAVLSVPRGYLVATAVGNTVLFTGGLETGFVASGVVDTLNVGTGKWSTSTPLSGSAAGLSGTSTGDLAIFAGNQTTFVEVYEPVGVNYCSALPNSSGAAATISALGSSSEAANDLQLRAECCPPGQPGIFYYGTAQISVPFGNGIRCVGGTVVRMPPSVAGPGGEMTRLVDNTLASGSALKAGASFYFQCWFRDPAGGGQGFNLSDGLRLEFTP